MSGEIHYIVYWPSGNTTALVTTALPRSEYVRIAREIMSTERDIEQVGFIEQAQVSPAAIRLQMMGGEFCGNAARSAATHWFEQSGQTSFSIEVSGVDHLIECSVDNNRAGISLSRRSIAVSPASSDGTIVDVPGIRHLVVDGAGASDEATQLCREIAGDAAAAGVMYLELMNGRHHLTPYVWVRDTNTLIKETACGSGTIACVMAKAGPADLVMEVRQPSGEDIEVEVKGDRITMSGQVKTLRHGRLVAVAPAIQ